MQICVCKDIVCMVKISAMFFQKVACTPPLDVLIRDDGAEREPANVVLHDNVIVHIEQRFYLLDLTLERPMT